MRKSLAFAAILTLASLALAQSDTEAAKSPKEVMREFVKLELEGARLTPEGRRKTASFLILPSTAPPYPINIVSDKFDVHEIPSAKNNPRLNVYFPYLHGQLDSALRFKEALHVTPGNGLMREGINAEYDLVLTKNRELEPDKRHSLENQTTGESLGIKFADLGLVKTGYTYQVPVQKWNVFPTNSRILFFASCNDGPVFESLWGIVDNQNNGRAIIVPDSPLQATNLYWGSIAWRTIATYLAQGKDVSQAVQAGNDAQAASPNFGTNHWKIVGDHHAKLVQ
jgi:hypothetical protein